MSLSYQPLNTVLVRDPITMPESTRDYAILKGGQQVTWKKYTTTNISATSISWSTPPPAGNVFIDSKQYVSMGIRLVFTAPGALTGLTLNPGNDAPRAYPINGSLEVLQSSINGQSFSIYIADMIHALTHYNTDIRLHNKDYSLTPTYADQTQSYADLASGNVRNPLGGYQNGIDLCPMGRGGFPFTIVQNTNNSAVVDMLVCEPLFGLSPYYWGCGNRGGFYNVTAQDFLLTFVTNGNRFWSHNQLPTSNPITNIQASFTNFTAAFATPFTYIDSQPLMLMKYITPDSIQVLSPNMPLTYPYFDVQRYPTDFSSAVVPGNQGATVSSNNLQLNSIPRMMYIYARTRNLDLYAAGTGCNLTDTYLSLENVNITFANYTGLLSSAGKFQLYQIASKNGCNMNYAQWSGEKENNPSSWILPVSQYGTIGSILAVEFATDLGLPSNMSPGIQGQFQLQVTASFKNTSNAPINATLYIIIISEGSFTIPHLNGAVKQLGVITQNDVLDAHSKPGVSYDLIRDSEYGGGGGNFLGNLKDFGSKILNFLQGSKLISNVASAIPNPIAQTIGSVARNMGYGEGQGGIVIDGSQYGQGVMSGGRQMSHKELRNRLNRM